jgi:membrane associated rhomboid family serine protease
LLPLKDNIPTASFPVVTVLLIAANVLVWLWQLSLGDGPNSSTSPNVRGLSQSDEVVMELGAIPYRLTHPGKDCGVVVATPDAAPQVDDVIVCEGTQAEREVESVEGTGIVPLEAPPFWVTILTSMFMHGGWLHIIGNMLFLWVFGNNIEDSMGKLRFLLFYLLAGTVAAYAQALLDPQSTVPMIGASGAVAGVLGGYILLHPHARVVTLVFIVFLVTLIEIPAAILLGVWFVLQFLPVVGQIGTDIAGEADVAYLAHVGGFVFGLLAIKLFERRRSRGPRLGYG